MVITPLTHRTGTLNPVWICSQMWTITTSQSGQQDLLRRNALQTLEGPMIHLTDALMLWVGVLYYPLNSSRTNSHRGILDSHTLSAIRGCVTGKTTITGHPLKQDLARKGAQSFRANKAEWLSEQIMNLP